jgi:hypothetical protein
VNRARTSEVIQPVKISKDYSWKDDIYSDIERACETGLVPDVKIPRANVNRAASVHTKAELIAQHMSRMGRKL